MIAAVLRRHRSYECSKSTTAAITLDLAEVLKADNPRFDAGKFHDAAAGVPISQLMAERNA